MRLKDNLITANVTGSGLEGLGRLESEGLEGLELEGLGGSGKLGLKK